MATKVTLAGKAYAYAFDLGAMMHLERIMTQLGNDATNTEVTAATHYACLLCDKNFTLSVDEFYSAVDSLETLNALNTALAAERARWEAINRVADDGKKKAQSSKKK